MDFGKPRKLSLACELAADAVSVARCEDGVLQVSSARALESGALVPSLAATNIVRPDHVRRALQEALAAVAGRSRDIITILPDGACRLILLDFDTLPAKREEADAVVRFRLKKSLPFDVDRSRVSYQAQGLENGKLSVVAAVVLNTVLEEYELLVREAGYSPGVLIPSLLAALGQVDASVPTLVIKVDTATTGVAIVDHNHLLLVRTLDNPGGLRPNAAQLAEDVYPSVVFYQDTHGSKLEKVLVGGLASMDELNASLEEQTGLRAEELVDASRLGLISNAQRCTLAGVAGALAS